MNEDQYRQLGEIAEGIRTLQALCEAVNRIDPENIPENFYRGMIDVMQSVLDLQCRRLSSLLKEG